MSIARFGRWFLILGNLKLVAAWIALILVAVVPLWMWMTLMGMGVVDFKGNWLPIARTHFAATIGLPMAALAALFLVLVLRITTGPIEAEVGPLKFKGAAGPLIFWMMAYLCIALTIKMMWGEVSKVPEVAPDHPASKVVRNAPDASDGP